MRFAALLALLPALALAQPGAAGVGLRRGDMFTTAPVTLYVDPAGNDAKLCTSSGTGACKTLPGALAKLPLNLLHNATINVAAGTYTVTASQAIEGFTMAEGVSLTIQGSTSYSTYTPPSGSATGTVTGFTALSFPSRAIVTDSSQSWPAAPGTMTANQLAMRGRFICFTSGPQSGNKYVLAGANTTTLELLRTSFTGGNPAAGNTYTLCTPSTVFTGTVPSSGGLIRVGNNVGRVVLNDLALEPTAGNTVTQGLQFGGSLSSRAGVATVADVTRVRGRVSSGSSSNPFALSVAGSYSVTLTDTAWIAATQLEGGNDSTAASFNSVNAAFIATRVLASSSYFRAQRQAISSSNANTGLSGVVLDIDNITASAAVGVSGGQLASCVNAWVNCYAYQAYGSHSFGSGVVLTNAARANLFTLAVDGCLVGLDLGFAGTGAKAPFAVASVATVSSASASLRFTTIGQASPTTGGAVVLGVGTNTNLGGASVTFTTVADGTRDYVCPNTTTSYTEAAVQALTDKFFTCQGSNFQR